MKRQILMIVFVSNSCTPTEKDKQTPNIIYIFADDLGYGDLSYYGQ